MVRTADFLSADVGSIPADVKAYLDLSESQRSSRSDQPNVTLPLDSSSLSSSVSGETKVGSRSTDAEWSRGASV